MKIRIADGSSMLMYIGTWWWKVAVNTKLGGHVEISNVSSLSATQMMIRYRVQHHLSTLANHCNSWSAGEDREIQRLAERRKRENEFDEWIVVG